MISIFDVPWSAVELEHVQSFLAEAGEEGLTWDAKSDGLLSGRGGQLKPGSIAKAACAFANQLGGYIIVGAERRSRESPWELPGAALPGDEPKLWLGKAVGQLRPVPRHDIRVWPTEDGRHVAVVQVEPITRTPCMTRDGRVYERVTSESKPVDDPARLHDLLQRGEQARSRAVTNTTKMIGNFRADAERVFPSDSAVYFALGLSATSYEGEIGRQMFTTPYMDFFKRRFVELLFERSGEEITEGPIHQISQAAVRYTARSLNLEWWIAQVHWDGSVVIYGRITEHAAPRLGLFPVMIEPAWTLAVELVQALGGYGDTYTQMWLDNRLAEPSSRSMYSRIGPETRLIRWGDLAPPGNYDLDSIRRELDRAAGYWVLDDPPPKEP